MAVEFEIHESPYCVIEERKRTMARWDKHIKEICEQLYIERRLKENGIDIDQLNKVE